MSKEITVHGHAGGPNPWKVVMLLEELNIPYNLKLWDFPDLKKEPYEKMNVNGRTPTIEDPNTGITLWESGAILEYLEETYDKEGKFTYSSTPEKFYLKQWYASRLEVHLTFLLTVVKAPLPGLRSGSILWPICLVPELP
jgi:glutathione S-transferase